MIRACRGPVPPVSCAWVPHLWWEDDALGQTRGGVVGTKTCPVCKAQAHASNYAAGPAEQAEQAMGQELPIHRLSDSATIAAQSIIIDKAIRRETELLARIRRLEDRLARVIKIAADQG